MPTRRQEKVARVVKEVVSDAIANHLSDPRIAGLITVTRVEMAPDLRMAEVYLSVLASSDADKNKTFTALDHATKRVQSLVGAALESKFCPVLRFHRDERFHKTLETMRLIDQVANERRRREIESGQADTPDI
ncbi:MAG TPA: 30S ribosome-binding factor RbfA [Sedimentisphaerales bacterium]|nr:30S ribosome-binding factor RbfA [Sedimentisphaerales bacterium]HRS12119.1 30S ribosome-binding factor RbfA [Sedimentisphaerales bacterium]HRV48717.1 30S ribosome-binding factor RbfA [Sedimentisphaerales bacterium]